MSLLFALTSTTAVLAEEKVVSLTVSNMNCRVCPLTVRKALEKVPGVSDAKVDFDLSTATITYDSDKTSVDDLVKATTNAGYPSKPKSK